MATRKTTSVKGKVVRGRLIGKRSFSRRQAFIGAALAAVIGVVVVVSIFAFSLDTSTDPNTVILSYTLPHHDEPAGTNLEPAHTAPLVLYGNGLAVCGNNGDESADTQYSMNSTILTQAQVHTLVQQVVDTGFLNLQPEYFNKLPIAEKQDMIQLNLLTGNHVVMYYNDGPAPAAYTATVQVIKNFCQTVTTPYQPSTVTVVAKAAADAKGRALSSPTDVINALKANADATTQATIQTNLSTTLDKANAQATATAGDSVSQTVSGTAAAQLQKQLGGKTHVFTRGSKGATELAIIKPLPAPKNEATYFNYAKLRQNRNKKLGLSSVLGKLAAVVAPPAQAADALPVRVVVLLGSDENAADGNNLLAQAQAWGQQVHDYYCNQVGKCYNYLGASVMRGSQSVAYYKSCQNSNCDPNELSNAFGNVANADYGTISRQDVGTQLITAFHTNTLNNSNAGCGFAFVGLPLGITDPYATGCFMARDIAHEFGHSAGLNHTGNGTLMDGPPYVQYQTNCGVGSDPVPTCPLDRGQAAALSAGTTGTNYFASAAAPQPTTNRLDTFVTGSNNHLYHKWWQNGWSNYEDLASCVDGAPAATSWGLNRVDVFYTACGTHQLMHLWWSGSWHSEQLFNSCLTGGPAAASWGANRIDVFARNCGDSHLIHAWWDGSRWNGWENRGGTLTSSPAVASWGPGRLDVVIRTTNNSLLHTWYQNGWGGWDSLGGTAKYDPAITSWGPGRLDVFMVGTNNALYHKWYANGWNPKSWEYLGGTLTGAPGAASWGPNRIDVFARGTDSAMYHKWWENGWSNWENLGGSLLQNAGIGVASWSRMQ